MTNLHEDVVAIRSTSITESTRFLKCRKATFGAMSSLFTEETRAFCTPVVHREKSGVLFPFRQIRRFAHRWIHKCNTSVSWNSVRMRASNDHLRDQHGCCDSTRQFVNETPVESEHTLVCMWVIRIREVNPSHKTAEAEFVIIKVATINWVHTFESLHHLAVQSTFHFVWNHENGNVFLMMCYTLPHSVTDPRTRASVFLCHKRRIHEKVFFKRCSKEWLKRFYGHTFCARMHIDARSHETSSCWKKKLCEDHRVRRGSWSGRNSIPPASSTTVPGFAPQSGQCKTG